VSSTAKRHQLLVTGVPAWVRAARLIGVASDELIIAGTDRGAPRIECDLEREAAADVAARLRGVGLGGLLLEVCVTPPLRRSVVRAARLRDARRRRDATRGFELAGTRVDDEGRVSLTPERLAMAMAAPYAGKRVLDAGCGAGGNAIAFARHGCAVVAVERDKQRLDHARHNARMYGVSDKIRFVQADAAEAIGTIDADLVFVDPPWGVDWNRERTGLEDYELLQVAVRATERVRGALLAKVPPSFDPNTVPGAVATAHFGEASGDYHRVKFVTVAR